MKKTLYYILAVTALLAISGLTGHAKTTIDPSYRPVNTPFQLVETLTPAENLIRILQIIAGGLLYFAAPLAVIMIIFIGFNMNLGGADSEKTEQAKKNLTWLIAGLFLIIFSYSLIRFVIWLVVNSAEI